MSPRKQPISLMRACIKNCVTIINNACFAIERTYRIDEIDLCEKKALALNYELLNILPARLFDILCNERTCVHYPGDTRLQLLVLTHPRMTVFRKCDHDNTLPQLFWIELSKRFTQLVILDLRFLCTDEILQVIGMTCPLLEEINIVSRVDICKSPFNASVLIRNVSDVGLCYIAKLNRLRILAMDSPRNERAKRVGRCVSQAGIIMLVGMLPCLEELRIESCDIGSTMIGSQVDIGPLNLKKINCHSASAEGIHKLIRICPLLLELSLTHLSEHNKDDILVEICKSNLRLDKLDLSFFSFSDPMQDLLMIKGRYLTHFSLWEIENTLNLNAVMTIGTYCPRLSSLCLMTQTKCLVVPRYFRNSQIMFSELKTLTLGNENFHIYDILYFFLRWTRIQKLVLKYQSKVNIDETVCNLLDRGLLTNINYLWFDCTLELSKDTVKRIIDSCLELQNLTVDFTGHIRDVRKYIVDNNLDLTLGSY